ncbi:MAG TPA: hypothetical protein VE955_04490 [Candidatus Dormibacteraeota bacterium]|nr:hypothetical protein [Candidatus Dormibacteraeota bacterium]
MKESELNLLNTLERTVALKRKELAEMRKDGTAETGETYDVEMEQLLRVIADLDHNLRRISGT